jgi:hypothetical protein
LLKYSVHVVAFALHSVFEYFAIVSTFIVNRVENCSASGGKPSSKTSPISCETEDADLWNPYQLLPFYIGIIFFAYFPVALMKCGKWAVDSGKEICSEEYSDLLYIA